MLKLIYITPHRDVARVALRSGVDRIFVDLERLGKQERQEGMDSVQSMHTFNDICAVKSVMTPDTELLVRSNPIHNGLKDEIESIIECGADIVMLPYFQRADQAEEFVEMVGGRAKCCLLIESREAVNNIDEILRVKGVDEYYVGLNDLHLDYGLKFIFEPLINGLLDNIVERLRTTSKPYGFGGVARIGEGALRGEAIIREHYRLGSSAVILSRSFCNSTEVTSIDQLEQIFCREVEYIRIIEAILKYFPPESQLYADNKVIVAEAINRITNG